MFNSHSHTTLAQLTDHIIHSFDSTLRKLTHQEPTQHVRTNPASHLSDACLSEVQKQHIARCMRVNHAGEVSAQALYQGQAFTAQNAKLQGHLWQSAEEERDHLRWCEQRLQELHTHTSLLNPVWSIASFCIGALVGIIGDGISLGFLAETERQVTRHLEKHRAQIPTQDVKTHAILDQMIIDEAQHAQTALDQGGIELPPFVKKCMQWSSRLLTIGSYYL